jgi:hypothetical protein
MDPRDRADAMLARARARHGNVVTPEDATSPMDATNTMQIPRAVVQAADSREDEPEITRSMPAPGARARAELDPDQDPPTGPIPVLAAETASHVRPGRPGQQPQPRQMDGLIPTVQEPPQRRSSLSRRLDGDAD